MHLLHSLTRLDVARMATLALVAFILGPGATAGPPAECKCDIDESSCTDGDPAGDCQIPAECKDLGCPPECAGSGVGLNIEPILCGTDPPAPPPNGLVKDGDKIQYRVTLTQPLPGGCDYICGQLSVTLPNGEKICVAGYNNCGSCDNSCGPCPTPRVPQVSADLPPPTFCLEDIYIVDMADADDGVLVARADYGPTPNQPAQQAGTVLSDIPVPANSATIAFPLMLCSGVIGDFVWNDENMNGLQDSGEEGLELVPVMLELQDPDKGLIFIAETMTDEDGEYLFMGLCPGDYVVTFGSPGPDYVMSPQDAPDGSNSMDDIDSDCRPDGTAAVTLTVNDDMDFTIDCGFYMLDENCKVFCELEQVKLPDDDDDDDGDDRGDDGGDDDRGDSLAGGLAGGDDDDDDNGDDDDDNGGGGFTKLIRLNFGELADSDCDEVNGYVDIGCDVIPVEDGQLVDLICKDGGDDDADDDDGGDDDRGDNVRAAGGTSGGDDDDDDDNGGGGGDNCSFQFVGDILVISSDMAVLHVEGILNGKVASEDWCDLCEFLGDPDGGGDDDDDDNGGDDGDDGDDGGVPAQCAEDFNGDDIVNVLDLMSVIEHWGPSIDGTCDLDGDGYVGSYEVSMVVRAWGFCSP